MRVPSDEISPLVVLVRCVCVLIVALVVGCKGKTSKEEPARQAFAAPPPGLICEFFVPHPDKTWAELRRSVGEKTPLPASAAIFLGGALDLPVQVLEQLDFNVPVVGALVLEEESVLPIVGVHVKDGPRVLNLFSLPKKERDGITLVGPPQAGGSPMAVADNYLLLGPTEEALSRAALFVARTLPARSMAQEDFTATFSHEALSGPAKARFEELWRSWKRDREAEDRAMRDQHGGSAPDFGDPTEALADIDGHIARFFAIISDLAQARLDVSLIPKAADQPSTLCAKVAVKGASTGGAFAEELASMAVAGADPLLALPASVAVAVSTRETAELRERSTSSQIEALAKIFGGRLDAPDKAKIEAALRSWSRGRGDWLAAGLLWSGPTRAAVLKSDVSDSGELARGAAAMLKLLDVPAVAAPLSNWVGDMKLTGTTSASAEQGAVQSVHVVRRPPRVKLRPGNDKPTETDAFDVVWSVDKALFLGAAGTNAKSAYSALVTSDPKDTLGRDSYVRSTLTRFGPRISFALLINAGLLSGGAGGEDTPLLMAYGKEPDSLDRAWFELDAPSSIVAEYASALISMLGSRR